MSECRLVTDRCSDGPCSIYQYSNMALQLSGQAFIFDGVFVVSKSLWELRDDFDLKATKPCSNIDISIESDLLKPHRT